MLEFMFKDENYCSSCPLVVFVREKDGSDLSRIATLSESQKKDLLAWGKFDIERCTKIVSGGRLLLAISFPEKTDDASWRRVAEVVYQEASRLQIIEVVWSSSEEMPDGCLAAKLALAFEYAAYCFDKYHTKKKEEEYPLLETVVFPLVSKPADWRQVTALANAVRYARDLGNEPPNILTPEAFALDIKRLEYLDIRVDLLDWNYIRQNKLGLIEAVAKGAVNKPYVAVMQWQGNPKQKEWDLGLVGKGVTYDSGGISIKTDEQQIGEKKDMCGAAAVVAAMKAAALQKLPVNLIAVLPLVENMPAGNAYKPDDVMTSLSGQTVEIVDTDGEGRLILADALWLLQSKYRAKTVVDMATLTGSTAYIFSGFYAGLLGNDGELLAQVKKAAEECGEKVWELPLEPEIDKRLNSEIADMKNVGKRGADSTQAACFLQRYIQKGVRWAHIDIAGCEADEKGLATGFGVLLLNRLMNLTGKK